MQLDRNQIIFYSLIALISVAYAIFNYFEMDVCTLPVIGLAGILGYVLGNDKGDG